MATFDAACVGDGAADGFGDDDGDGVTDGAGVGAVSAFGGGVVCAFTEEGVLVTDCGLVCAIDTVANPTKTRVTAPNAAAY